MEDEKSCVHTDSTNIHGNDIKLFLQRGDFLLFGLNSSKNLTFSGQVTNNNTEEPALALLDLSSRKENWGWNIVGISRFAIIFLVLLLSLNTLRDNLLAEVIGLARERRLIGKNTGCLDTNAIDRDVHSVDDLDDVTDLDVLLVHHLFLSVSSQGNLNDE
jgi:hypothetical protein